MLSSPILLVSVLLPTLSWCDQSHASSPGVYTPQLTQTGEYQYSPGDYQHTDYVQASANGNGYYDPGTAATAYGYSYDYPQDQLNELDDISDKQGIITAPIAFLPFLASFSLPLGAAIATFLGIVGVSAVFFLFPQTVQVDVNSTAGGTKKRSTRSIDSFSHNNLEMSFNSSSTISKILDTLMVSMECQEAASCEIASLARSQTYPVLAQILEPFLSHRYYDRFLNMDCSSLKCKFRHKY